MVTSRFDIFLVRLDPTEGREIRKTRPCLIISPDEMNHHIDTVIVASIDMVQGAAKGTVHVDMKGHWLRASCAGID